MGIKAMGDINECMSEICLEKEEGVFWLVSEPNCLV